MAENQHELRLLGQAIASAREDCGLTRKDLALTADVDQAVLAAVEKGLRDPDFELLLQLADAMNTRVSAFVLSAEDFARAEAEGQAENTSNRRVTIRWRSRQSSSPNTRDIEAGLTITFAGRLMRHLTSWLFPAHASGEDHSSR